MKPIILVDSINADGSREHLYGLPCSTGIYGLELNDDFAHIVVRSGPVAPDGTLLEGMAESFSLMCPAADVDLGVAQRNIKATLLGSNAHNASFEAICQLVAAGPWPLEMFRTVCLITVKSEAHAAAPANIYPAVLDELEARDLAGNPNGANWRAASIAVVGGYMLRDLVADAQALASTRKTASATAVADAQTAVDDAQAAVSDAQAALADAQAALADAQVAEPLVEADIAAAQAALTAAQAALTAAKAAVPAAQTALATAQTVDAHRSAILAAVSAA